MRPTAIAADLTKKGKGKFVKQTIFSCSQCIQADSPPPSVASSPLANLSSLTALPTLSLSSIHDPPPSTTPEVVDTLPMPPHFMENCTAMSSQHTFKNYAIESSTLEYQTISNMMNPMRVKEIEQVVNPEMWTRFIERRNAMVSQTLNWDAKSVDENEVLETTYIALNRRRSLTPYSENMTLLFHCTNSQKNLTKICSRGFDKSIGSFGKRIYSFMYCIFFILFYINLGKGIYFSDNPLTSVKHDGIESILICAVMLGDCASIQHDIMEQPRKYQEQKRNVRDEYFDSVVARPDGVNKYVIYNR